LYYYTKNKKSKDTLTPYEKWMEHYSGTNLQHSTHSMPSNGSTHSPFTYPDMYQTNTPSPPPPPPPPPSKYPRRSVVRRSSATYDVNNEDMLDMYDMYSNNNTVDSINNPMYNDYEM
jgi:hypothetical protein